MTRNRWLGVGFALLLVLTGCSEKGKKITAIGSYAPVIAGLHISHEPAVRGVANDLSILVTNVNGIPLAYHWSTSGGTLRDSTSATVTWDAPDSIGSYEVYVSLEGTDPNEVYYFREKTYAVYVDNDFERWTGGGSVKFDVAPPGAQAPDAAHPLLYAEFDNATTGQSHVSAVSSPLGAKTSLTGGFFAAASPTMDAGGALVAFAGRATPSATAHSIYLVPATGSGPDTTNATPVARFRPTGADRTLLLANPRFARTGTMLAYNSDSITTITSNGSPHVYVRDASNFAIAPQPIVTGSGDRQNTYWMANWNGAGDSLACESYRSWKSFFEVKRGIFGLLATPPFQTVGTVLLLDPDAREVDWSPDGQYLTFTRVNPAGDRDIWILRSDAASPSQAVRITRGPADDAHPRFSFDGAKIYFVSNRADRYGLNGIFGTERRGYNVWSVSQFDRP
jgi:WD40-like Beta Propeller Repeat